MEIKGFQDSKNSCYSQWKTIGQVLCFSYDQFIWFGLYPGQKQMLTALEETTARTEFTRK